MRELLAFPAGMVFLRIWFRALGYLAGDPVTAFILAAIGMIASLFAGACVAGAIEGLGPIPAETLGLAVALAGSAISHHGALAMLGASATGFEIRSNALCSGLLLGLMGSSMASEGHYDMGMAMTAAILATAVSTLPTMFASDLQGLPKLSLGDRAAVLMFVFIVVQLQLTAPAKLIALPILWAACLAMSVAGKRLASDDRPTPGAAQAA